MASRGRQRKRRFRLLAAHVVSQVVSERVAAANVAVVNVAVVNVAVVNVASMNVAAVNVASANVAAALHMARETIAQFWPERHPCCTVRAHYEPQ